MRRFALVLALVACGTASSSSTDAPDEAAPPRPSTAEDAASPYAKDGASPGADAAPPSDAQASDAAHAYWLSGDTKRRAEQLTSLFENDTIVFQYGYIEALGDGRGYTAGRAGFTSATGDMLEVVQKFTATEPSNALAQFLPRLKELADAESDAITGLEGLPKAWQGAAKDPVFQKAQDDVVDELYFVPAMQHADALGAKLALTRAAIYDAIIQHGDGTDPDGLSALLDRAKSAAGGDPSSGVDEKAWLGAFLTARRADLADASDPSTRDVWAESVGRCDVLRAIADAGNYDLHGPIDVASKDWTATIP